MIRIKRNPNSRWLGIQSRLRGTKEEWKILCIDFKNSWIQEMSPWKHLMIDKQQKTGNEIQESSTQKKHDNCAILVIGFVLLSCRTQSAHIVDSELNSSNFFWRVGVDLKWFATYPQSANFQWFHQMSPNAQGEMQVKLSSVLQLANETKCHGGSKLLTCVVCL